jgi:hypothetical protein
LQTSRAQASCHCAKVASYDGFKKPGIAALLIDGQFYSHAEIAATLGFE